MEFDGRKLESQLVASQSLVEDASFLGEATVVAVEAVAVRVGQVAVDLPVSENRRNINNLKNP